MAGSPERLPPNHETTSTRIHRFIVRHHTQISFVSLATVSCLAARIDELSLSQSQQQFEVSASEATQSPDTSIKDSFEISDSFDIDTSHLLFNPQPKSHGIRNQLDSKHDLTPTDSENNTLSLEKTNSELFISQSWVKVPKPESVLVETKKVSTALWPANCSELKRFTPYTPIGNVVWKQEEFKQFCEKYDISKEKLDGRVCYHINKPITDKRITNEEIIMLASIIAHDADIPVDLFLALIVREGIRQWDEYGNLVTSHFGAKGAGQVVTWVHPQYDAGRVEQEVDYNLSAALDIFIKKAKQKEDFHDPVKCAEAIARYQGYSYNTFSSVDQAPQTVIDVFEYRRSPKYWLPLTALQNAVYDEERNVVKDYEGDNGEI